MSSFVPIEQASINLSERADSRMLIQFWKSPVLLGILQAFITEINALQTVLLDVIKLRNVADATGVNLDLIGKIVGQNRVIFDYTAMTWLTPDTDGTSIDQAPVWVQGAYLNGEYTVDDAWFKELIQARIFRNFTKYGSIPEIQQVIKQGTGYDVGFYRNGPMEMQLVVNEFIPSWVLTFILRISDNRNIEGVTFSPFPATLNINSALFVPNNPFMPDISKADESYVSVSIRTELGATI